MTKTLSEKLFESYCKARGCLCSEIPTGPNQTPDYRVTMKGTELICEVKELTPNDDEKRQIQEMRTQRWTSAGGEPGKRLKDTLNRSYRQLKQYQEERIPLVTVLYDNIQVSGDRPGRPGKVFEPAFIDMALHGLHAVLFGGPSHGGTVRSNRGRRVSQHRANYLSAVWVLTENPGNGSIAVIGYHNFFASIPLPLTVLSHPDELQFRKQSDPIDSPIDWERC